MHPLRDSGKRRARDAASVAWIAEFLSVSFWMPASRRRICFELVTRRFLTGPVRKIRCRVTNS